jgi:transcription initiation factor TFIIH subunit 1
LSPDGIHRATLQSCYQVEATSTEFLRLFWRAVLPPAPNDLSALALSSPVERAARAERFKGCLDNSVVRIKTVISGSGLPTTTTGGGGSVAATARSRDEQRRIEAVSVPVPGLSSLLARSEGFLHSHRERERERKISESR